MLNLAQKYSQVLQRPSVLLLLELEKFVNGAILQIDRVERSTRRWNANMRKQHPTGRHNFLKAAHARLFLDAHFYFICVGQVDKFLGQLCRTLNNAALHELRGRFQADFETEIEIRNDLEHLDERAVGRKRSKDANPDEVNKWMGDFVNFFGSELTFGGKKCPVNKEAAKRLRQSYRSAIAIIRRDYALKDTRYVADESRDKRIKRVSRIAESLLLRSTRSTRKPKRTRKRSA
jgi:hypothetical protein